MQSRGTGKVAKGQFLTSSLPIQGQKLGDKFKGFKRRLIAEGDEALQGLKPGTTASLLQRYVDPVTCERRRKSLLGNSWHVQVAAFCLQALLASAVPIAPKTMERSATRLRTFVREAVGDGMNEYSRLISKLQPNLRRMQQWCPFHAEQGSHSGPFGEDLWASAIAAPAMGVHTKNLGTAHTKERLDPIALPPLVHAELAQSLEHPLVKDTPLAPDLQRACQQVLRLDYEQWVAKQIAMISSESQNLRSLKNFFEKNRLCNASIVPRDRPSLKRYAGQIHWLARLGLAMVASHWSAYCRRH